MKTSEKRIQQYLETLAQFTATPGQGMTRMSYSSEAAKTRAYLKEQMEAAGLMVREDVMGNVFGRRAGTEDLPPVMIGSHFDSVPHGGIFDGPAGIVAALEVATCFHEQNLQSRYPLEVVALVEEEGASFGAGLLASRAMVNGMSLQALQALKDKEGVSAAQRMEEAGYAPEKVVSVHLPPQALHAFLELHIEQGSILENEGLDVGLVDVIVGICQLEVTLTGQAGHAGTTPMNRRADALVKSAELITQLEQWAIEAGDESVATVGRVHVYPNGANVIPQKVTLTLDIRSKNDAKVMQIVEQVQAWVEGMQGAVKGHCEHKMLVPATQLSPAIHEAMLQKAQQLGLTYRTMVSGAGHDAMIFAKCSRVGLIFVPSKDGLSHHPDEWTDFAQIQKGAELMFEVVKELVEVEVK